MTRVAMVFVSRRAVAEEVVQETWLNVVRGLDSFEAKSSLRTWIYAILRNCARRRAEQEQRLVPLSELAADEAAGDDLGVDRDRFFEAGFAAERAWQLERLIERLGLAGSTQ